MSSHLLMTFAILDPLVANGVYGGGKSNIANLELVSPDRGDGRTE